MPSLCADHTGNYHERHHVQGVGIHAIPPEILMQHYRRHHRGQPQKQPERTQVHRADIDIGIHTPRLIKV